MCVWLAMPLNTAVYRLSSQTVIVWACQARDELHIDVYSHGLQLPLQSFI